MKTARLSMSGVPIMVIVVCVAMGCTFWSAKTGFSEQPARANLSPGLQEIVRLAQAGMSDDVILAYINNSKNSGASYTLTSDDVLYLKNQGVSQNVISALSRSKPDATANIVDGSATNQPPPVRPIILDVSSPEVRDVVGGNTAFAINLYARLRTADGNLFFSPYSISTILAMTYAGARGDTEKQIATALNFTVPQDRLHPALAALTSELDAVEKKGLVQLTVANSLWPQTGYPFLTEYLGLLKQDYDTSATPLHYREASGTARKSINDWVEAKTNRKITELIPPGMLDSLICLVLVDAIYFKGNWASEFKARLTTEQPFHLATDRNVTCQLMNKQGRFGYAETPDVQVLELPYAGDDLSMIVLLPRKMDGIGALENDLAAGKLAEWTKGL